MSLAVFLTDPHLNDPGGLGRRCAVRDKAPRPCSSPAEPEGATDFLFLSFFSNAFWTIPRHTQLG